MVPKLSLVYLFYFLMILWQLSKKKELILCISGVCQPISKIFGDPLPVWGNPNLILNQCPWCISSYG
jgi:hypothetical protein